MRRLLVALMFALLATSALASGYTKTKRIDGIWCMAYLEKSFDEYVIATICEQKNGMFTAYRESWLDDKEAIEEFQAMDEAEFSRRRSLGEASAYSRKE